MKNSKIKKHMFLLGLMFIILINNAVFSEPGSEKDPLVSLSYLEKRMEQLKYYIDEKLSNVKEGGSQLNELKVVEVLAGQSLIGKSGTEIILRGGKAKIVASELGGLADITIGRDLKMGEVVPSNHLLIVPRNDERGVYAITDAIYLVRGEYEIR